MICYGNRFIAAFLLIDRSQAEPYNRELAIRQNDCGHPLQLEVEGKNTSFSRGYLQYSRNTGGK